MSLRSAYRGLCLSQTYYNFFIEQYVPNKQVYGCTQPGCKFYARIQPNSLNHDILQQHSCVVITRSSYPLTFKAGSEVILTFSFDELFLIRLEPGQTFYNRYGAFAHDYIMERGPGYKIISTNGRAHCFALEVTPNLHAFSLTRQTQILFYQDASFVCSFVCPGYHIAEAGVGSGAVSVRFLERVACGGYLYGYDLEDERTDAVSNRLSAWKEQFEVDATFSIYKHDVAYGFKGVPSGTLDFVFLDLPSPKDCVGALKDALKPGAPFVVFLPCIEQIHDFAAAGKDLVFIRKVVKVCAAGFEYEARTLPASLVRRQFKGSKDSEKFEFLREVYQQRTHTGYLCVCGICCIE